MVCKTNKNKEIKKIPIYTCITLSMVLLLILQQTFEESRTEIRLEISFFRFTNKGPTFLSTLLFKNL